MGKKLNIPLIHSEETPRGQRVFNDAVRYNLEVITGYRGDRIVPLEATATTTDIINKINEIINVLQ